MVDDPDSASVADAAATFREEYDGGADALEAILAVDAERDTWAFHDVPIDSGTFGELVSRDIVTRVDDEFRVSSRRGVKAGLEGRTISTDRSEATPTRSVLSGVDVRATAAVLGALGLLLAMRTLSFPLVFRDGRVVSPANDPYHYRYWLEELLARSNGITDAGVLANLPERAAARRPVTHAGNWLVAELLGGDQWAAEVVTAWLPVAATVALGVVVYWLAVVVAEDVRVGVASVVFLAITPIHAGYTSLAFLEHRLYQYLWFGVTLLTLAWLAVDLQRRRERTATASAAVRTHLRQPWTWVVAAVLGTMLGLSMHTWGGSILLLGPVAAYVGLKVAAEVRAGLAPGLANAPILLALGLNAALTAFLHVRWGWHEAYTPVVAALVTVGAVLVVGLGELWRRVEWSARSLVGLQALVAGLGVGALRMLRPAEWGRLRERAGDLLFRDAFAESVSLFTPEWGIVFGPLPQIGLHFYLAVLVLGWACWVALSRYEPRWMLLAMVTGFWLVLAAIQLRFAAQLSIVLAVLGGLGFVQLLAWIDLARPASMFEREESVDRHRPGSDQSAAADGGERPPSISVPREPRMIAALLVIAALICGLSLVYLPTQTAQLAHDDSRLDAIGAIEDHAAETDRQYPENFVLSEWDENRLYNYFVNGESMSYGFAAAHYEDFRSVDDPDDWYGKLDDQAGYVVVTDDERERTANGSPARLRDPLGGAEADGDPLEHFRTIYVDDGVVAYAIVPGATIVAPGEPGASVTVAADVEVGDEVITYDREAVVESDGTVAVTVPYPGEYAAGDRTATVSPADVESGSTIRLG